MGLWTQRKWYHYFESASQSLVQFIISMMLTLSMASIREKTNKININPGFSKFYLSDLTEEICLGHNLYWEYVAKLEWNISALVVKDAKWQEVKDLWHIWNISDFLKTIVMEETQRRKKGDWGGGPEEAKGYWQEINSSSLLFPFLWCSVSSQPPPWPPLGILFGLLLSIILWLADRGYIILVSSSVSFQPVT